MRLITIVLIALLSPAAAWAEDGQIRGWYLGGGPALNNVFTNEDIGLYGSSERGSSDTGFVVTGGYRINRYVAVEAAYVDGAAPRFESISIPAGNPNGIPVATDITQETEAIEASVVGILPFLKIWEIYAKGGIASWDASSVQRLAPITGAPAVLREVEKDGVDFLVGVGFGVTVWRNAHLRFEVNAFRTDDELLAVSDDDREARFDSFAAEFHWRFGGKW